MSRRGQLEGLAAERLELARELLAVFDAAARPILGDLAVWVEEAGRDGPAPLPWPLQPVGTSEAQLLGCFAAATVANALQAIEQAHGPQWVPPEDPADEGFQWVLRVACRATDAGQAALRARFGGAGRLSIKREILKLAHELQALAAVRPDMKRGAGFKAAGLSKSAAYRALHRRRKGKPKG
ncbi:MAG: hypothetical protein IPJ42_12065 [Betaproteobacteria bacterium]|nr:hypothetical protein [Betaproteobacteria bacterium]